MLMMKLFCAQQDREHVGELDPHAGVDVFGNRLYDNVDLMRRTPNAQHVVISARNDEGDKTSEAANHRSLVIRRHADQLGALIST